MELNLYSIGALSSAISYEKVQGISRDVGELRPVCELHSIWSHHSESLEQVFHDA